MGKPNIVPDMKPTFRKRNNMVYGWIFTTNTLLTILNDITFKVARFSADITDPLIFLKHSFQRYIIVNLCFFL